ncbi:alpha/beta fold hydrolase [Nocardia arthritidis]|uniref:Alpha/beta fold hydrolase n=1 Tax=Nocardia arthritidis TaxID=228602 RepID=A0A6G9YGN5_9NOCA|nr:alpha/beta fold hydrolase [Nocardia arthritidis]QIS12358.1 alpha/beta fold hydrolase [Nocardia arthritidis]
MNTPKRAAVVLVHGLFSSARTWADIISWIAKDAELTSDFDVFAMQYESPKVRFNPLRAIPDYDVIADYLRTYLDVRVAAYERIVLVSHSQGGLIVQRYLARMIQRGRGLELRRIAAVVMLACPNSGSELAILLRRSASGFWKHPQEAELRPIAKKVTDAQQIVLEHIQYAKTVDAQNCPIPLYLYAGTSDNVVRPASAAGLFPEVKALPGDHFSIIAADSAQALVFLTLRSHLLGALVARPPSDEPDPPRPPPDPPPARTTVRHNLTALSINFVDRATEVRRALDGLASRNPVVCISGLGGMGKSALANRIGWLLTESEKRSGARQFDTVMWCDRAASTPQLDAVVEAVSEVMDFRYLRALPTADRLKRTIEHLNGERCLVIIDDLDAGDESIRELIRGVDPARSKFLVTARQRYSREAWPIDLDGLDDKARARLAHEEGDRLQVAALTSSAGALLREYLAATGGNPLAIRLTAAQMRYDGDDLRSSIARLRAAADHDIFDPIFDRSWNVLSPTGQVVVLTVALHAVTVSREAVGAALGLDGERLRREIQCVADTALVDFLHSAADEPGRLRLHPLTRAYALRQLTNAPQRRVAIEDRLIGYYRSYSAAHADIYSDPARCACSNASGRTSWNSPTAPTSVSESANHRPSTEAETAFACLPSNTAR